MWNISKAYDLKFVQSKHIPISAIWTLYVETPVYIMILKHAT